MSERKIMFYQAGGEQLVGLPTISTGRFAALLNERYCERVVADFGNNSHLLANPEDAEFSGSNIFKPMLADEVLQTDEELIKYTEGKVRIALPRDFKGNVLEQLGAGSFYSNPRAIVFQKDGKLYDERNKLIVDELQRHIENKVGTLMFPALVYGLRVEHFPEDKKGYELRLVPTDEFTVIQDERLLSKWNEHRFDTIDGNGIALNLRGNGEGRIWYTSDARLRRFSVYAGWAVAGIAGVAGSGRGGRVVVVSAEGGAQNSLDDALSRLQEMQSEDVAKVAERYERAKSIMRGN